MHQFEMCNYSVLEGAYGIFILVSLSLMVVVVLMSYSSKHFQRLEAIFCSVRISEISFFCQKCIYNRTFYNIQAATEKIIVFC